jgi:predicted AAA+ superfamily ATPase
LLTGSSARKLKSQNINLLGGRARFIRFHPFTFIELKEHFSLEKVVNYGLIPGIYFSNEPEKDLDAYVSTYVQQEIANEGLVRNLTTFTRFLEVAALCHAEQLDYTSVSNDAQIPRTTIHEYFKILEDTLIGHLLPAWRESKKRKPIATSKFYFFDWAIPRKLQELKSITQKSEIFGKAFESYMFHEIKTFCDYHGIKDLHYWRTKDQSEVDFIIDNKIAVEVKGSEVFNNGYLTSLIRLKEEEIIEEFYLIYLGKDLTLEKYPWIKIMNYKNFLTKIYSEYSIES